MTRQLQGPAGLTVVALLIAAVGFVTQMVAGVTDMPTIPPGLVVILIAAGLIAFVPRRWVPLAGVGAGLFNLVASFAVDAVDRLSDSSPASGFPWLKGAMLRCATSFDSVCYLCRQQNAVPAPMNKRLPATLVAQQTAKPRQNA
jgi:hypothetical protein